MINVTELAVLLHLPFTMTLLAGFLFYSKEVTLEVMGVTLIECLLIRRFRINFMAGTAAVLRVHQINTLGIEQGDMGAVRIRRVGPLAGAIAPFGFFRALLVL